MTVPDTAPDGTDSPPVLTEPTFDDLRDYRRPSGAPPYVYFDRRIPLAVNVALATRRPLLVTGDPGTGKSSLARDVAARLDWAYLSETVTSRTRIEDLVASFDAVARLNDAQLRQVKPEADYMRPGVLWWAVHPSSAIDAAGPDGASEDPREHPECASSGVVLLLDEIDKAEPDLPNDLLAPLDVPFSLRLPRRPRVEAESPHVLVIITSNGERRLPPAFLRRCVSLELSCDDPDFFRAVAATRFGPEHHDLYVRVAERTLTLVKEARAYRRRAPSMAEYLDTVQACLTFGVEPGSQVWRLIEETALSKRRHQPASDHDDEFDSFDADDG